MITRQNTKNFTHKNKMAADTARNKPDIACTAFIEI